MPKTLATKLLKIQMELKPLVKGNENPFFKSKYADINDILALVKPLLSKYGVVLLQPITSDNINNYLNTRLIDTESLETENFSMIIPANPDMQKFGASITYLRRFALQSLFALEAEDDDDNIATGKKVGVKPSVANTLESF